MISARKLIIAGALLTAALAARTASAATDVDLALAADVGIVSVPVPRLHTDAGRELTSSVGLSGRLGVGPVVAGLTGEIVDGFVTGGFAGVRGAPAGLHLQGLLEGGWHAYLLDSPGSFVGSGATLPYVGGRVRFEHAFSFASALAVSLSVFVRHDIGTQTAPYAADCHDVSCPITDHYVVTGGTMFGLTLGLSGTGVIRRGPPPAPPAPAVSPR